jgi:membrane protease YdiL (CAAX protease family)
MMTERPRTPAWTWLGLGIALGGIPLVIVAQRAISGDVNSAGEIVLRESVLFLLFFALIAIVLRGERLPLASIGVKPHIGRSLLWGLGLLIPCVGALALTLLVLSLAGLSYGGGTAGAYRAPLWAVALTVLRAGVVEETFYRGYAIERLRLLTGSTWIAATVPLLCFALFHYRQGIAGIVVAFALGAVLTAFYLWKRDLVAAITAHFLLDVVPNILLPLISGD